MLKSIWSLRKPHTVRNACSLDEFTTVYTLHSLADHKSINLINIDAKSGPYRSMYGHVHGPLGLISGQATSTPYASCLKIF